MKLWVEKSYPYAGGAIAALLWYSLELRLPSDRGAVLASSLTLGAILTGFLATSKTILIGLRGSEIMQRLRESGYIEELVRYLAEAIWLSFAFSLLALAGFFVNDLGTYVYNLAWVTLGTMSALAFVRATYVIIGILKHDD